MCCAVGASMQPSAAKPDRWVLRFTDRTTANAVALATGCESLPHYCEVVLPVALVDLAVSFDFGLVEVDSSGDLVAWHAPSASVGGELERHQMPTAADALVAAA